MKTFKHDFGDGVSCTLEVADAPPANKDSGLIQKVTWSKDPGPHGVRRYVAWMNSVNFQLSKEWNVSICHVFQISRFEWEAWGYWPGMSPKILLRSKFKLDLQAVKAAADKCARKMGIPVGLFNHVTVEQ
jgi:hypothetical protein